MEAEPGNTREVGVREFQFHLQGRLTEADLAAADWAAYFAAAARKLDALRSAKASRARIPARRRPPKGSKAGRPRRRAKARTARRATPKRRVRGARRPRR